MGCRGAGAGGGGGRIKALLLVITLLSLLSAIAAEDASSSTTTQPGGPLERTSPAAPSCPAASGGIWALVVVEAILAALAYGYIAHAELQLRRERAAGARGPAWGYPPSGR